MAIWGIGEAFQAKGSTKTLRWNVPGMYVLGIARRPLWLGESAWGKGARDHVTEVRGRVEVDLPGSGRPWEGLHLWGATGEL